MQITLISATNRPGSYTHKVSTFILNELKKIDSKMNIEFLDLAELPLDLFKPSSYAKKPAEFERFKKAILQTDAILSVVPEYNGAAPGVFKYFIDMLPFPESLRQKPCAFVGVADGRFGGVRAVEQIMQVFEYRQAHVFSERTFMMNITKTFDEATGPKDEMTRKVLQSQLENFVTFVRRFS